MPAPQYTDPRYNSRAWRVVRKEILERDGYICQIRGSRCAVLANQVDHIIPAADGGPFFDHANLRASCHSCNSGRANKQKRRDGWRRGRAHIVLVAGPPGSGKTTYASERAGVTDIVVDYDAISEALGPQTPHAGSKGRHAAAMAARNAILRHVREGDMEADTIYILSANPKAETIFPFHEVVVLDPGRDEVLRRVREHRPPHFADIVNEWYAARQTASIREW